jgi:hypothetical protein
MRRHYLVILLCVLTLTLSLASCHKIVQDSKSNSSTLTPNPSVVSTPETGKASVAGWVIQDVNAKPYSNGYVNLAKVYRNKTSPNDGAFVLDSAHSPGTPTYADGTFLFENIDAGEYVLVVGSPDGKTEIYRGEDGKPKVWKVVADSVLDVGEIKTGLTPQD